MKVEPLKPRDIFVIGDTLTVEKPIGDLLIQSGQAKIFTQAAKEPVIKPKTIVCKRSKKPGKKAS